LQYCNNAKGGKSTSTKREDAMIKQLYKAFLSLETLEECENFMHDICTVAEVHAISQRLEVAKLLEKGHTYEEIEKITGASTATISRIKRYLNHGKDGYKTVLKRI